MGRKIFRITVAVIASLCLFGCLGKGTDTIKISESYVTVDASAQTVNLYTEGDYHFDCIYYSTENEGVEIYDVNISSSRSGEEYDYAAPWFSIRTGDNRHHIIIDLQQNTTGKPRYFRTQIHAGDYYQWISVFQEAK